MTGHGVKYSDRGDDHVMADILVVDDDPSIATAFQRFLSNEHHDVRVANNAPDAYRAIAERRPDLVLMDVRLPGQDGLHALQEMRTRFPRVVRGDDDRARHEPDLDRRLPRRRLQVLRQATGPG